MMRWAPKTIMGQLIAGTLLVQLVVFGVFLSFSVRDQFRESRERDRVRLQRQSTIIAASLAEPMQQHNDEMIDDVMHELPIAASLKGVRVTDVHGTVLRNTSDELPMQLSDREQKLLPKLLSGRKYLRVMSDQGNEEGAQPIVSDGLVRGILWVTQDSALTMNTPKRVLQSLLIYFPFALLGNVLLVWALTATLAQPLRQLRRATLQLRNDPNDLSAFPLSVPVVAAQNEAGALLNSFNGMVNEIARQRRGTQETLNLLDAMLRTAPIGFAFYDRDYRYIRINDRLAKMHGVRLEQHLGRRLRDLLPAAEGEVNSLALESEQLVEQVFRTGEGIAEQELSGEAVGDTYPRIWLASYFPVFIGEEVRWVGVIVTEVTERRHAEEAMRRSEKLAIAGRLASSIAHEINTPLEAVTNALYLLRNNPSLDVQAQDWVALAQTELERVGEITQQTLRFHRQSSIATDIEVTEMLRSVLLLHTAKLRSAKVQTELRLEEQALLFGYAGELRQLFANLVGNAIDAMPQGGRLFIRARTMRHNDRRGVRVTIADEGMGMSNAVRRRIFEPFFTTKDASGTGLGLWVSAEILEKHHGDMLVRSRQAKYRGDASGTVFSLFFPWDGVPRGPRIVQSSAQVLADHLV
ncbi:sensor histidine kinase [Terriglobus roseus]|uniref:histidine kinase n=1 Tax=Terriglobus roseus TaxID=392734 RepID=A0A1G7HSF7_9BACT|nr:ATP-binding protein [Terriglobus roseus]SDF03370.1 His Kinase A (phospho-acceptor) domain-containing protein [Terriglobus roseus]